MGEGCTQDSWESEVQSLYEKGERVIDKQGVGGYVGVNVQTLLALIEERNEYVRGAASLAAVDDDDQCSCGRVSNSHYVGDPGCRFGKPIRIGR